MAGDDWQKFANLRAYYAFMWGYPGKKLLFMGQEFAPAARMERERAGSTGICCDQPSHAGVQALDRAISTGSIARLPALHARDCEAEGFEWLIVDDAENSVFAWLRKAGGRRSAGRRRHATSRRCRATTTVLPLPRPGRWRERLNTDAAIYGGSGRGNLGAIAARRRAVAWPARERGDLAAAAGDGDVRISES